jgi:hypothetical protein
MCQFVLFIILMCKFAFMQLSKCLLLLLLFTQCKSPSQEIKDAFKTIDKSFDHSNKLLQNSFDSAYSEINSLRSNNLELAIKADSIYASTSEAINFIERQKELLQKLDSSGENVLIAEELLVKSSARIEIKKRLFEIKLLSYSCLVDQSKRNVLDSVLSSIAELKENANWELLFENTPTVSARTILRKFQNDCENAASIVLGDMREHMVR